MTSCDIKLITQIKRGFVIIIKETRWLTKLIYSENESAGFLDQLAM